MKATAGAIFLEWYNKKVETECQFNVDKELLDYCGSDVQVLQQCCMKFRDIFIEEPDYFSNPKKYFKLLETENPSSFSLDHFHFIGENVNENALIGFSSDHPDLMKGCLLILFRSKHALTGHLCFMQSVGSQQVEEEETMQEEVLQQMEPVLKPNSIGVIPYKDYSKEERQSLISLE
uniref:Uncharacterized protein n=1 Tax=Romanomermis culicivorax TaxID=13658 RepID=A0A915IP96_ROMCU